MADLTANRTHETQPRNRMTVIVTDTVALFAGALVGVDASDGFLDDWDNAAATRFWGLLLEDVTGDTSATPAVVARVDTSGVILLSLNSVGDTPAQVKVGEKVFSTTGNTDDMTLAAATTSEPIGILTRFGTTTDVDVMLFTPAEYSAQQGLIHA